MLSCLLRQQSRSRENNPGKPVKIAQLTVDEAYAREFIQNSIIQEKVVKLPDIAEAKRFFNYPFAAIEEALSNAVYHKGYDVREPIEVRVLPDRIEIVSHPGADRSITDEGLKTYHVFNRRYRNRRIGEFLTSIQQEFSRLYRR